MASAPLFALTSHADDLRRIEAALAEAVHTDDSYLKEMALHLITAGGKLLRPLLTTVSARLDGGPLTDASVQGGVACELVQTGSLCHDDVMDEADVRRGVETVNARWGNLQAIVAGDFLLARASEIAASLGTDVAALLARTIGRLCEGQTEELRHTYNVARPEASYLSSISGKTASLFATAARIGGLVSDASPSTVDVLTSYGDAFGMVFQIVDDVLDITSTGDKLGKPAGHDMEEGVYTLPVLRTLQAGGVGAAELLPLLGRPLQQAERDKALEVVRGNGGVQSALDTAREWVNRCTDACTVLPQGEATDVLRTTPQLLLASVGG
jgi:heptaprenyl diphosphate synthase